MIAKGAEERERAKKMWQSNKQPQQKNKKYNNNNGNNKQTSRAKQSKPASQQNDRTEKNNSNKKKKKKRNISFMRVTFKYMSSEHNEPSTARASTNIIANIDLFMEIFCTCTRIVRTATHVKIQPNAYKCSRCVYKNCSLEPLPLPHCHCPTVHCGMHRVLVVLS